MEIPDNMKPFVAVLLTAAALLPAQEPPRSNVSPPRVLSKAEPDYTEEARRARVNASVTVKLIVRPDGKASDIRVVRAAGFGLDENAIECVGNWQFAPGTKDGKALSVAATIEVNFRLLAKDNEGQHARLTFTLPSGFGRPELVKGTIPPNPGSSDPDQRFRIGLTVDSKGRPENLAIIETTDPEWADRALHELEGWRFVPASVNGQPAAVEGVFELAAGSFRYLH
jgi:TonB family protein